MSIRLMTWFCRHLTLASVALGCAMPAWAQVGYRWTPEDLTAKADCVVIDEVVTTRDTQDARTYATEVAMPRATAVDRALQVPADAKPGQTIHVILEGTDGGSPTSTRCQRVILTVQG